MKTLSQYKKPIQLGFAILVVAFIVGTVAVNWDSFTSSVARMDPRWLLGSLLAGFLGVCCSMLTWRSIVLAFGYRITIRDASFVVFVSQIGKYLPGGVWPIVAGSQLGRRAGLPRTTTAVTLTAQLGVSLVTGSTLATGALLGFPALREYAWLLVGCIALGTFALLPPVLRRILRVMFRLLRRSDQLPTLRTGSLLAAVLWSLLSWAWFGVHIWAILSALGTVDPAALLPAVCGYALAWVVGFLAIVAPAGAGVREAILALVLTNTVAASSILGIVLVSRFVLILVDVAVCGYAILRGRVVGMALLTTAEDEPDETTGPDPR